MRQYRNFAIAGCLALGLAFCSTARADDATGELPRLIRQVKSEKISAVSQDELSQILQALLTYSPDDRNDLKEKLFAGMGTKRAEELAQILDADDALLFMLMYYTRQGIADNLTDAGLHRQVAGEGQGLIKRTVMEHFTREPITAEMYDSLAAYPPDVAADYFTAVCNPWFVVGPKPYGAPASQETFASDSYFSVVYAIREVEWARQSVVVRLMDFTGAISIPATVDAQFTYSGKPDVTIELTPPSLTIDDIPALEQLLDNPYYGTAAMMAIEMLQ